MSSKQTKISKKKRKSLKKLESKKIDSPESLEKRMTLAYEEGKIDEELKLTKDAGLYLVAGISAKKWFLLNEASECFKKVDYKKGLEPIKKVVYPKESLTLQELEYLELEANHITLPERLISSEKLDRSFERIDSRIFEFRKTLEDVKKEGPSQSYKLIHYYN